MTSNLALSTQASTLIQQELAHDSLHHPNLGGITRGGMANHYPMTILALLGLGATDQEILNFKKLWPRSRALIEADLGLKDTQTVLSTNWHDYLGESRYLREFKRVFENELKQKTIPLVVNQALSVMQNGLPMGLFHPVIRLSFANSYQDKGQIADALAYMAIRYQDLFLGFEQNKHSAQPLESVSAESLWQEISKTLSTANFELPKRGGSLNICEVLCSLGVVQDLALNQDFELSIANLDQQIQDICLLALRLYLHQPALTTLHAVTAAQALAELKQNQDRALSFEDQETHLQLWRRYWIWLTGLFIEKGYPLDLPQIDPAYLSEIAGTSWSDLAIQARRIPEVHLIKMTYSCQWLAQQAGEDQPGSLYYKLAVINMLHEQKAHPRNAYGTI